MARTSRLGIVDSVLGDTMATGVFTDVVELFATAADTLEIGEVLSLTKVLNLSASDTLEIGETLASSGVFSPVAADTLQLSDTSVGGLIKVSASDTIEFTDETISSLQTPVSTDTIVLSDESRINIEYNLSVEDTIQFGTIGISSLQTPQATDTFVLTDVTFAAKNALAGTDVAAVDTVEIGETLAVTKLLAGALSLSASDTIEFNDITNIPIERSVSDTLNLSDASVGDAFKFVEDTLVLSDTFVINKILNITVSDTLELGESIAYESSNIDLCHYSPFIGSGPMSPTEPTLTKAKNVTLFYPTVSPTDTVTIRAPEFGDRDRLKFQRINRETRGGTLKIFADPAWPKTQQLSLSFIGLKESEGQEVLDFMYAYLGQEVGFTDWEGRTWHGFIVGPEQPLVRNRADTVDVSIEFEGEIQ